MQKEQMTKFVVIVLIALLFEAVGVVFLSGGLKQLDGLKQVNATEIFRIVKSGASNGRILTGVFFEAIFFGFLLYLLSQKDVSLVWPLTALGYVVTSLAAKFFLREDISCWRWAGVALIVAGAAVMIYSEKVKERRLRPEGVGQNIGEVAEIRNPKSETRNKSE